MYCRFLEHIRVLLWYLLLNDPCFYSPPSRFHAWKYPFILLKIMKTVNHIKYWKVFLFQTQSALLFFTRVNYLLKLLSWVKSSHLYFFFKHATWMGSDILFFVATKLFNKGLVSRASFVPQQSDVWKMKKRLHILAF